MTTGRQLEPPSQQTSLFWLLFVFFVQLTFQCLCALGFCAVLRKGHILDPKLGNYKQISPKCNDEAFLFKLQKSLLCSDSLDKSSNTTRTQERFCNVFSYHHCRSHGFTQRAAPRLFFFYPSGHHRFPPMTRCCQCARVYLVM